MYLKPNKCYAYLAKKLHTHRANILNLWCNDLIADARDPCVIAKLDMAQAFPTICRALNLDVFSGDYACGFPNGDTIPSPAELSWVLAITLLCAPR